MTNSTASIPALPTASILPVPLEAEVIAATAEELYQRVQRLAYALQPGKFFNFDRPTELREVRDLLESLQIWADEVAL